MARAQRDFPRALCSPAGALVLKSQPQVGIFQYEGYNYLGLGVILLGTRLRVALHYLSVPFADARQWRRGSFARYLCFLLSR